jgi:hypothetical protein
MRLLIFTDWPGVLSSGIIDQGYRDPSAFVSVTGGSDESWDVVGQLMREGLSPQTRSRIEHAAGGGEDSSGGLGQIIGSMLGRQAGQGSGGLGGLLGGLGSLLGGQSAGGVSRGQAGGIGDLVGSLLGGGGGKGAVGGSAMALLGTLALSVLKNWQAQAGSSQVGQAPPVSEEEMRQIAAPETAELCLRGMIEAVKADGEISQDEVQRIIGKLQEGGITAEEKQFVEQECASRKTWPGS